MSTIAIVTGSRDWKDEPPIWEALYRLPRGSIVMHGYAPGADEIADKWGRRVGLEVQRFRADWKRHGKGAGPIRNRQMRDAAKAAALHTGWPVVCLAFPLPQSIGTLDMMALCRLEGWEVRMHSPARKESP